LNPIGRQRRWDNSAKIGIDVFEDCTMSDKPLQQTSDDLEVRQDEVLRQLDELNIRLERALIDAAPHALQISAPRSSV